MAPDSCRLFCLPFPYWFSIHINNYFTDGKIIPIYRF